MTKKNATTGPEPAGAPAIPPEPSPTVKPPATVTVRYVGAEDRFVPGSPGRIIKPGDTYEVLAEQAAADRRLQLIEEN